MSESTRLRVDELEPFQVERWAHATTTGSVGRKAVLQYLAARADESGSCFPGQQTMATATEQGERTVRRHIADMVELGLLCHESRKRPDGRGRTSDRYYLHVDGECARSDCPILTVWEVQDQPANLAARSATNRPAEHDQPATGGRRGNSQSLNFQKTTGAEQARTQKRARDPLWDALIEACGFTHVTPTPPERGAWNKALKDIRAVGATPELVHERARAYRKTWPNVRLTPSALARHWGSLGADEPDSDEDTLAAYGLTRG